MRCPPPGGQKQPLLPDPPALVAGGSLFGEGGNGSPIPRLVVVPTKEQITEALRPVIDPELRRSIVDLGMVRSIEIREGGKV